MKLVVAAPQQRWRQTEKREQFRPPLEMQFLWSRVTTWGLGGSLPHRLVHGHQIVVVE